jgi:exodeoxyribonuclease VII large subunit
VHARQRYARLSAESVLVRLRDAVNRRDQRLDELRLRLDASMQPRLRQRERRLAFLVDRLRRQDIATRITIIQRRLQSADQRLLRTSTEIVSMRLTRLNRASIGLRTLSPVAVLSRGYALIYTADNKLLRSATEIAVGQTIRAHLANGSLEAKVTQTEIDEANVTETDHS